jgi:hypothetical protein
MCRKPELVASFLILLLSGSFSGQSTVANTLALYQTRLISTTKGTGTAFAVDVDNREYWITAKHIFTGIANAPPGVFATKTVEAKLLVPYEAGSGGATPEQTWRSYTFTAIDPGKDIDILVLAPKEPVEDSPFKSKGHLKPATDLNPIGKDPLLRFGGDCEFLGYPYGWGSTKKTVIVSMNQLVPQSDLINGVKLPTPLPKTGWLQLPFVKHCTLSGSIVQNNITIFVLDGINNLGFSGAPVLAGNGDSQAVFAVISGFHAEPLEVLPAPERRQAYVGPASPSPESPGRKSEQGKEIVESNSGLIEAYDITPAIKAIRANPIGPLLTTQKTAK